MRSTCIAAFAACLAQVQIVVGQKCSNNNCLRAVEKTTAGRNATADCLSFLEVTVTPSSRTSTTTVTVTSSVRTLTKSRNSTSSAPGKDASTASATKSHERREAEYEPLFDHVGQIRALEDRQLTVSATSSSSSTSRSIPKYATPCSSVTAYSSACSCIGASRVTTTAIPRTTTKTVTSTRTIANATVIANYTSSLRNSTMGQGWNATSSKTLWQSDSAASLSSSAESSASSTGHSSWLAASSTASTVVHVLNTTTLITITRPSWANSSSPIGGSLASNGSTAPFLNSSTVSGTLITNTTSSSKLNMSMSAGSPHNSTTPRWQNTSAPVTLFANSTRPVWLNTSFPTRAPNITTGRWLNTTSAPLPANITSFRWLNSTMLPNATAVRWLNSSSAAPTSAPTVDTTCGETAAPFALQVSQPEGMYDGWYVQVSGNGLLFTSVQSSASSFSVEASGHLCAIGRVDRDDLPRIAAVGIRDPSSDVWLVESRTIELLDEDYAAVRCTRDGLLSCAANATNPASHWLGCGLQLDLSSDGGGTVPVRGLNCSSLALNIVSVSQ